MNITDVSIVVVKVNEYLEHKIVFGLSRMPLSLHDTLSLNCVML